MEKNKFELALIQNNLAALSETERLSYYNKVCESLGLNPLTQPFSYITLNGKLCLYANRACTEQLRQIHNVSVEITKRENIGDVYVVSAKAKLADGRYDESTGAVNIANLKGDMLANALMKAETKSKRRVTLSICGLAFLDESELDTIPSSSKEFSVKVDKKEQPKQVKAELVNDNLKKALDYKLTFTKDSGKTLGEVLKEKGVEHIKQQADKIIKHYESKNKELDDAANEYLNHATTIVIENQDVR